MKQILMIVLESFVNSFTCDCADGFTGTNCETGIEIVLLESSVSFL